MKTSQKKAHALLTPHMRFVEMMRHGSMSVER